MNAGVGSGRHRWQVSCTLCLAGWPALAECHAAVCDAPCSIKAAHLQLQLHSTCSTCRSNEHQGRPTQATCCLCRHRDQRLPRPAGVHGAMCCQARCSHICVSVCHRVQAFVPLTACVLCSRAQGVRGQQDMALHQQPRSRGERQEGSTGQDGICGGLRGEAHRRQGRVSCMVDLEP